jgi:hypothetical protein
MLRRAPSKNNAKFIENLSGRESLTAYTCKCGIA